MKEASSLCDGKGGLGGTVPSEGGHTDVTHDLTCMWDLRSRINTAD